MQQNKNLLIFLLTPVCSRKRRFIQEAKAASALNHPSIITIYDTDQADGKRIDSCSDIFGFGSMIYEMLTGQRAFPGDTRPSTIASILREVPKPISQLAEGLPREVERMVRRCLRKDPEHRFQMMADLRVALEELKEESDSGSLSEAVLTVPKRRRRVASLAALLGAIVIGAVAFWYLRPTERAAQAWASSTRPRTPSSNGPLP